MKINAFITFVFIFWTFKASLIWAQALHFEHCSNQDSYWLTLEQRDLVDNGNFEWGMAGWYGHQATFRIESSAAYRTEAMRQKPLSQQQGLGLNMILSRGKLQNAFLRHGLLLPTQINALDVQFYYRIDLMYPLGEWIDLQVRLVSMSFRREVLWQSQIPLPSKSEYAETMHRKWSFFHRDILDSTVLEKLKEAYQRGYEVEFEIFLRGQGIRLQIDEIHLWAKGFEHFPAIPGVLLATLREKEQMRLQCIAQHPQELWASPGIYRAQWREDGLIVVSDKDQGHFPWIKDLYVLNREGMSPLLRQHSEARKKKIVVRGSIFNQTTVPQTVHMSIQGGQRQKVLTLMPKMSASFVLSDQSDQKVLILQNPWEIWQVIALRNVNQSLNLTLKSSEPRTFVDDFALGTQQLVYVRSKGHGRTLTPSLPQKSELWIFNFKDQSVQKYGEGSDPSFSKNGNDWAYVRNRREVIQVHQGKETVLWSEQGPWCIRSPIWKGRDLIWIRYHCQSPSSISELVYFNKKFRSWMSIQKFYEQEIDQLVLSPDKHWLAYIVHSRWRESSKDQLWLLPLKNPNRRWPILEKVQLLDLSWSQWSPRQAWLNF